jgi:hypothetical protein
LNVLWGSKNPKTKNRKILEEGWISLCCTMAALKALEIASTLCRQPLQKQIQNVTTLKHHTALFFHHPSHARTLAVK